MILHILRDFVLPICVALGIRFLAYAVTMGQHLSSLCYSRLSRVCGIAPCGVFRVQDSAILIAGGEGNLGRTIALNFSELGYTVFTLHPTQQQTPVAVSSGHGASTSPVTLLYSWHKKKELSGHTWGLLAPIVLDMSSGTDRKRASETIKAYCSSHSLQLVALISLFTTPQIIASGISPSGNENSSSASAKAYLKRGSIQDFSRVLVWADAVAQSVRDPIVILQDYIEMLARVSGRIIMLSASHTNVSPHLSASDKIQRYIAQYMGPQLHDHGIKLCTVTVGHICDTERQQPDTLSANNRSRNVIFRWIRSLRRYFHLGLRFNSGSSIDPSRMLAVSQEDVLRLLKDIVAAEYPKDTYCLGFIPYLSRMLQVIPTPLRLLINTSNLKLAQ